MQFFNFLIAIFNNIFKEITRSILTSHKIQIFNFAVLAVVHITPIETQNPILIVQLVSHDIGILINHLFVHSCVASKKKSWLS